MTARELNRAVARATGETAATIARLGFSFLMDEPVDDDFADRPPLTVDWDGLDAQRAASLA
jgi:hypothetical protein